METEPIDHLQELRGAPALPADPRPGTRQLSHTALAALGIELVRCDATRVVARMPVSPASGFGALLVLAETAASTAAGFAVGGTHRAFGTELDAALLTRPAAGIAVAEATPLVLGVDRHTWRIVAVDASGAHVLEARCTLSVVEAR